jgi:hypothetical protein
MVLTDYARQCAETIGTLQAKLSDRDKRLAALEKKLEEIRRSRERPYYIEDVPGKRVPFFAVITFPVPFVTINDHRAVGIHTLSMDGPFVATDLYGVFLPTSSVNRFKNPSSDEPENEFTANSFSVDVLDFLWELEDAGGGRYQQNLPVPSAILSHGRVNLGELSIGGFYERQGVIRIWITPSQGFDGDGTLYMILKGFKILVSQSFEA